MTFTEYVAAYEVAYQANPENVWLSADIETAFSGREDDESERSTSTPDGAILRVSFSYEPFTAVSIPWTAPYLDNVRRLLLSPGIKVFWNQGFDVPILESNGFHVAGTVWDAMDAFHLYEPDLPKGLEWVSSFCTDLLPWKHLNIAEPALYSCIDADAALRNMIDLKKALESRGQFQAFLDHSVELMPILAKAGAKGNKINVEKQNDLRERLTQYRIGLEKEAQPLVPRSLKPRQLYKRQPEEVGGDYQLSFQSREPVALDRWDIVYEPSREKVCSACGQFASNKSEHFKGAVGPTHPKSGKPTRLKNPCKEAGGVIEELPAFAPMFYEVLDFNPNSSDQLKAYIRAMGHPMGKDKKDSSKETADAKHLEWLIKNHGEKHPIYAIVLEVHKLSKTIGTYLPEPDANGYIHTEYVNCVTADHDVLTPDGWQSIATLKPSTLVAQWEVDGTITFVAPTAVHRRPDYNGRIFTLKGQRVSIKMTPGHRVIYKAPELAASRKASARPYQVKTAETLPMTGRIPTTGVLEGKEDATGWARIAVALQADGNIRPNKSVRWGLRRHRKLLRLRMLLSEVGVPFTETVVARGTHNIAVKAEAIAPVFAYLTERPKEFVWPAFLNLTTKAKQVVLAEVLHWDGSTARQTDGCNYSEYVTCNGHNAVVMQTLAHLVGRGAGITQVQPVMVNSNIQHVVRFNTKTVARLERLHERFIVEQAVGMFCVTVPSGFMLIRHDGKISVTGNSPSTWRLGSRKVKFGTQIQNWGKRESNKWAKEARGTLIASPGCKLIQIDSASVEAVMLGWFMGDAEYIALASQSVHAWLACKQLGWDFNPDTVNKVKAEHGNLYDQMKVTNHMTNYGGTPYVLWQTFPKLFATKQAAELAQANVFRLIPKLKSYQHNVRWRAQKEGYLETPWHIRHPFYDVFTITDSGETKDGKDSKRVVAFEPQSSNGTFQRDNLRLIAKTKFGDYLCAIANVHDSMGLDCPTELVDEAVETLLDVFTRPIPQMGGLRIGAEVEVGDNWGSYHPEKNPGGMQSIRKVTMNDPGILVRAA